MSTIKVDTIATRTGSGNITASNTIAGTSATLSGTLGVTGAITGTTQTLNRSGNGVIQTFQKDGSTIGQISGTIGLIVGTGDTGLGFQTSTGDAIIPQRPDTQAGADNLLSFGNTSYRFKDMYLGGNLYIGGTGSANALDDYEEGTWTPTVQNATGYSSQFGRYFKVGHLCFLNANVTTTGASGSTNEIRGLPFTSASTGNSAGNLSIGYYSGVNTPMVWLSGYVINNSNIIYITGNANGHTGETIQYNGAQMFKSSGNSRIMFSVVYHVA